MIRRKRVKLDYSNHVKGMRKKREEAMELKGMDTSRLRKVPEVYAIQVVLILYSSFYYGQI